VLRWLAFVAAGQHVGLSLAEIGDALPTLPTDRARRPGGTGGTGGRLLRSASRDLGHDRLVGQHGGLELGQRAGGSKTGRYLI